MYLSKSAADAMQFFRDQEDHEVERLFWSQFSMPKRPLLLYEQMAEWEELHRLSGLAMRYVIDHLWPKGPRPDNYFGLLQQFLGVISRIDAMKRSACIEGARSALARVKAYWTDMEATIIATQNPAGGRIRPQATTKGSEDLPCRLSARDNGVAGNGSPPSLLTMA